MHIHIIKSIVNDRFAGFISEPPSPKSPVEKPSDFIYAFIELVEENIPNYFGGVFVYRSNSSLFFYAEFLQKISRFLNRICGLAIFHCFSIAQNILHIVYIIHSKITNDHSACFNIHYMYLAKFRFIELSIPCFSLKEYPYMKNAVVLLYNYFARISEISAHYTLTLLTRSSVLYLVIGRKKNPNPFPILKIWFGLYWFSHGSPARSTGHWAWILAARYFAARSNSAVLKPHWGLIHYGFFKSVSRFAKKKKPDSFTEFLFMVRETGLEPA